MVQAGLVLQGYANGSTVVGPGGAHNASRQVASSPFLPSTSNATTLGFNCLVPGSLGLAPSQPPAGPEMTERSTSSSLAFLGAGLQGLSLVSGSLSGGFVSTGPGAGLLGALSSSAGLLDGMTQHHLEAPGGALYGASNVTAKLNGYSTGGGGGRGGSSQPYGPGYGGFSSQQQHSVPPQAVVASAVKVGSKVFVGGLSWETSDQKLRQYFENYGEVLEAFVSYDKNTGRPRGFGFVVFAEPHIADKVVSLQHTIDRREVEAKKAVPRQDMNRANNGISGADNSKVKKIFVGGLAPTVDEKAFREYFQQYGDVEDAVVMYDPHSSRPRGFGFVTFESEESVDNVFLHGVMQELHEKQIEIKRAVPREEMVPPRRTRPAHGGAGFVPPHRSAPHVSKQSYSISPPQQQQLLGSAGWSQQGYYNQSAATVQHQQTAAVASSRMQQATQDHMYSSLTAGLAAARSLSISNGINALMGNGNNLPSSIDLGALDLGGIDSSHMGFAQDTGFGNHQINAPSPGSSLGGLPQVYGSFPDRALSNEAGYSSSFSGGGSYGLGFGFQGGNL